ncbi:MAG: DUF2889 domain-containing protein, partial [Planctomycetota bacterium]
RGHLRSAEDVRRYVPILLILPNGILAEQTLEVYEDQIRESLLMQRLPGVREEMIPALLDRVVRGISVQAGGRKGEGKETVYLLERKGMLVFAGGGAQERERIEAVLTAHDYPFQHVRGVPATRIEFDKAMISIVLNVGGLIHTVKPDGELIDLRMGDLCKDPTKHEFVTRITRAVFDVGKAIGAYPPEATYEEIWAKHRNTILAHAGHVTSSLKSFRDALAHGLHSVRLFPNEEWILTPLCRYAARAGMPEEERLFRSLKRDVQAAMARAIRRRDRADAAREDGARPMNLAAQRNISVELFETGSDDVVLVGTMLDNEHLIKLEVTVYLPDEQITRSRLSMVRVPFPVCREVESLAERLVGLRIQRGVLNEIHHRVGGKVGCSHIKELAINIVYFVASYLVRRRAGVDPAGMEFALKPPEERFVLTRDWLRDSCLAYCQTTPMGLDEQFGIRRLGEAHTHPVPLGDYEPSLGVLLRDRAERFGDRVYLTWREGEKVRSLTWADFGRTVMTIASHLVAEGIRPGDRIAVLSENRAEMFQFELAVMAIGAVDVPIFAGYPPRQLAYILNHARPRWLIVSGKHQLDKVDRSAFPWIQRYVCMDADEQTEAWGAIPFATLTETGRGDKAERDRRIESVRPDDECMVMYTSGTTGPPKGVRLRHRNLISQQKALSLLWDVNENDVFLSYLPWHHSFGGLFERFMTLYNGCTFCLDDSRGRDVDRMIDNWRRYDPSLFFSVPRVHDLLLSRCREEREVERIVFGGRLRFVFTAGAPLPAKLEAYYREHHIPVLEGWGLTETSPCVTVTTLDGRWKSGYVGRPIPGVSVRLSPDQEILVKGPNVMIGYLHDEEATSHVLDADGWFRTGDLGEFTDEGLRILGRKDGAFKLTNGEKVHPQRIENLLVNESPWIRQAVVVGSGKDFVAALIYPDKVRLGEWANEHDVPRERMFDDPAVRELFAEELARLNPLIEVKYHRVRRAVLIEHEPTLADGELTPSGKLIRQAVFDRHRERIEAMFAPDPASFVVDVPQTQLQKV